MESRKRKIKKGEEFDRLFPPPSLQDVRVKKQADVEDTMRLIQRTVPKSLWQTQKIAQKLKGRTLEETCSNIWHFVYEHIQYRRDEDGVEQVRSPRRTWWEREKGVDCDCYTEFISSILLNLNIPHLARITKYPKRPPEIPRWQHVYPIVPRNGRLDGVPDRDDYIVIDCVKDEFDDEQPFEESKDYDMRLDYLDGIEEEQEEEFDENAFELMDIDSPEPDNVDLADLASIYDDEELGKIKILKKVGGAIKKAATKVNTAVQKSTQKVGSAIKTTTQKVGSAVKTSAQKVGTSVKASTKVLGKQLKTTVKKVGDKVGQGIRVINRFANPATILLRNGFLLAMKINLMNVAGRLRFAYLTDAQAKERNMNPDSLKKLRAVKDRAETVYWQAGGKKENLKKAILSGKGNSDKKVPLSGLFGLDDVYQDAQEYNIIHSNVTGLGQLGDPASGAALAAATGAVSAIAAALSQIKGLFNKGGKEEQAFQSQTDNAGNAASAPATIPEDEDQMVQQEIPERQSVSIPPSYVPPPVLPKPLVKVMTPQEQQITIPEMEERQDETQTIQTQTTPFYEPKPSTSIVANGAKVTESALPDATALTRRAPSDVEQAQESSPAQASEDKPEAPKGEGFIQKTTTWVKENPGKSLLIAGAVASGGYLILKSMKGNKSSNSGLNGLPSRSKKNKRKKRKEAKKIKIERKNLL